MGQVETKLWPAHALPEDLAALIEAWTRDAFPDFDDFVWQAPLWHVLALVEEEPVSYLGICRRRVRAGDTDIPVAGVGTVMTPAQHRKQGYASAVLARAASCMREVIDADFGLLVTDPKRFPFYGRLGWQPVKGRVHFSQPDGSTHHWDDVAMILPLTGRPWPAGPTDLCGLPW